MTSNRRTYSGAGPVVGGTSFIPAKSTTASPRRQGGARRAATRRNDLALYRSSQTGEQIGQNNNRNRGNINYVEIKKILDNRRLTDLDIKKLAKAWQDQRGEEELNQATVEAEIRTLEKSIQAMNVTQLGHLPEERSDGSLRVLVCQLGGCASKEIREFKMAAVEKLINKYNISTCLFMELNFNWSKVNSSKTLGTWLRNESREVRSVTAHNIAEDHALFSKHQPGGSGIVVRHEFIQYAKNPTKDHRELGRWCSWSFSANPNHVTRIVVAYRPCLTKTKGLKTVYQQHKRYMYERGIQGSPVEMFDKDLSEQVRIWRGAGERVVVLMDANENPLKNNFYRRLKEASDLTEFTHKCWGKVPPHTHARGTKRIDGRWRIQITRSRDQNPVHARLRRESRQSQELDI